MSNFPFHIFRGYDIRGLADSELTEDNVIKITRAYITMLFERRIKQVVIGYDTRLSSKRIHKTIVDNLLENGVDVIDFGLGLTQIMYFAQYRYLAKGGIFVTASHNPADYNGVKLGIGFSDTLVSEEIIQLKEIVKSGKYKKFDGKGKYEKVDVYSDYEKDLLNKVSTKKKYKIVIDACNGTAGKFLPHFLRTAGHEVIEQNCELDGNFPHGTPDPTEKHVLQRLADRVIKEKADVGFSYDCDGDRIGIVDENGRFVWNDNLVSIYAMDILQYLPSSPIIFNTLCSQQVIDVIKIKGGKPVMWMTGHSFIKAKVKEIRAPFGGELSGHFFFMDNFYGHDDGAFASMRLLSYMERTKQSLGQIIDSLPKYISSPEIKFGCPDDRKFDLINNEITKDIKKLMPKADYVSIDGIRADFDTKMLIIRASQNGPYITVKFEAKKQKDYDWLKLEIKKMLQKYKEIDFASGVNKDALDLL